MCVGGFAGVFLLVFVVVVGRVRLDMAVGTWILVVVLRTSFRIFSVYIRPYFLSKLLFVNKYRYRTVTECYY